MKTQPKTSAADALAMARAEMDGAYAALVSALVTPRYVKASQPKGGILWQGASQIDGSPIVLIATFNSANRKTGAMVQTWILRADMLPADAVRSGADASICGDCPHRSANSAQGEGFKGRSCYVNVGQAPQSIYRAFARGSYETIGDVRTMGAGRMVRIGSYGDPAAVPAEVWQALTSHAKGWTGYTHQWRKGIAQGLQGLCMASADCAEDADEARADGWRTFRVRTADEARAPMEFVCPASAEAGAKTDCATCGACNGANGRKGSPVIVAHGAFARSFAAAQGRASARIIQLHAA